MNLTLDPALEYYLGERLRVLAEVRQLLIASVDLQCAPDEIDPDTVLFGTGLGLDSLDAAEIIIGLEVDLGLELAQKEQRILALRSVNALVDLILHERGIST